MLRPRKSLSLVIAGLLAGGCAQSSELGSEQGGGWHPPESQYAARGPTQHLSPTWVPASTSADSAAQ